MYIRKLRIVFTLAILHPRDMFIFRTGRLNIFGNLNLPQRQNNTRCAVTGHADSDWSAVGQFIRCTCITPIDTFVTNLVRMELEGLLE